MSFKAYIVEDSPTIRQNLIETLQELAQVEPVGIAETEHEGKRWLARNDGWDVAIDNNTSPAFGLTETSR